MLLVVNPRAVGLERNIALLEHGELKAAADQRAAGLLGKLAIGVVDEGDGALRVAQHDQVALRFEQAAGAFLGLLQFPIAIGQRFVMQRDLAQSFVHKAQPHAQRGEPDTGERKQETGADRKGVGVIAGILGPAAGDKAIGAAEGGGKDHEGADRENQSTDDAA